MITCVHYDRENISMNSEQNVQDVSDASLSLAFSACGAIVRATIVKNKTTGESRGTFRLPCRLFRRIFGVSALCDHLRALWPCKLDP